MTAVRTDDAYPWPARHQLKQIPARAFVAVDESCLMIAPGSGRARRLSTAARRRAPADRAADQSACRKSIRPSK
jgi:hypothetical protein